MSENIDISAEIKFLFSESIKTKQAAMEKIADNIASAVNLLANAFEAAHSKQLNIIALAGCDGGKIAPPAKRLGYRNTCTF